jgi:hypothetical protein
VRKLLKEHGNKVVELESVKTKTLHQMWSSELDNLRVAYMAHKEERANMLANTPLPLVEKSSTCAKKSTSRAHK